MVLSIRGLSLRRDDGTGSAILQDVDMDIKEGEVIVIRGESGSGKTTLLKCIAELNVYDAGDITLHGKRAGEYGVPIYRTKVQYVPQRPSLLPGTPVDLVHLLQTFSARQKLPATRDVLQEGMRISAEWGVDRTLWMRNWSTLSGGEGQRIALAIAIGCGGAEVLLLDEPTSALDQQTTLKVEKTLLDLLHNKALRPSDFTTPLKAIVVITHDAAQGERMGTRIVDISRR